MLDGRFDPEFTLSLVASSDPAQLDTLETALTETPETRSLILAGHILAALIGATISWLGWRA